MAALSRAIILAVVGAQKMHCRGCERTVEFALARLPGVHAVKADLNSQTVEIVSAPGGIDLAEIRSELEWIGYRVEVL